MDPSGLLSIFEASTGDDHAPSPITSPAASESSAQSFLYITARCLCSFSMSVTGYMVSL